MYIFFVVVLAAAFSALSVYLIHLHTQLSEKAENDGAHSESGIKPIQPKDKLFYALMAIINICVVCFLKVGMEESLLSIANLLSLLSVLWAAAWSDWKSFLIPNRFLLIGLVARLVLVGAESLVSPSQVGYTLLGSAIAAGALFIVALLCRLISPKAIGFGDVKLLMLMGFCLSMDRTWGAMLCSLVVTFLFSLYLIVFEKASRQTELPFAPMLLAGTLLSIFLTSV